MLTSANRDQILNALGHEFGHYSKEDDIDKTQDIANHTGRLLENRTKDMVSKEATEDTLAAIRNNKNVITGEEGKKLAESIPMDRREYYKTIIVTGSVEKFIVGAEGGFGVEGYEKEGKPIKDFQGIRTKISGSVGFLELELKEKSMLKMSYLLVVE